MNDEVITTDGEVLAPARIDSNAMVDLARAEIDMQIMTARRFPRQVKLVSDKIMTLATLDEETAEECCYALVYGKKQRGGEENKPVEGPSIRLAEIAVQSWGNCRVYARVVQINRVEKYVEAEGIFHDLETNSMSMARTQRRIAGSAGNLYPEHLIITTANAACAIAKRNAILAGIPRGVYRPAYRAAREIIAGNVTTLSANRDKMVAAYASYGVKPEQLTALLGLGSMMELRVDHIATLRALYSSIKNGENKVEEVFAPARVEEIGPKRNPLNDDEIHTEQQQVSAEPTDGHQVSQAASQPEIQQGQQAAAAGAAKRGPGRPKLTDEEKAARAQAKGTDDGAKDQGKEPEAGKADHAASGGAAASSAVVSEMGDHHSRNDANPAMPAAGTPVSGGENGARMGRVYPMPAFIEGSKTVTTHDDLAALYDQHIAPIFDSMAPDAQQKIRDAKLAAEDRLDALDADEMEKEGEAPPVDKPAGPEFPAETWGEKDARFLTNAAKGLRSKQSAEDLAHEVNYWRTNGYEMKLLEVKAAFDKLADAAKARFMPGGK